MIISEKQICKLMNQLHDHISLHEKISNMIEVNSDYLEWLYSLRDEITCQQPSDLKEIPGTSSCCSLHAGTHEECK